MLSYHLLGYNNLYTRLDEIKSYKTVPISYIKIGQIMNEIANENYEFGCGS